MFSVHHDGSYVHWYPMFYWWKPCTSYCDYALQETNSNDTLELMVFNKIYF